MNSAILYFNLISDFIFNLIVTVLKPFVRFGYNIYRCYIRNNKVKKQLHHKGILHKAVVSVSICIAVVIIILNAGFLTSDISAHDNDILHKYYTSVTVHPGDSLWSIANEHYQLGYDSREDYINEVMQINHITDADDLTSGTSIVIPYYSEEIK